jgi:hypothetical protein
MRKARTKEEIYEMQTLLYIGAHVLACGLGYFLEKYVFGESLIDLPLLILFYVVLYFANAFFVLVWATCLSSSKNGIYLTSPDG